MGSRRPRCSVCLSAAFILIGGAIGGARGLTIGLIIAVVMNGISYSIPIASRSPACTPAQSARRSSPGCTRSSGSWPPQRTSPCRGCTCRPPCSQTRSRPGAIRGTPRYARRKASLQITDRREMRAVLGHEAQSRLQPRHPDLVGSCDAGRRDYLHRPVRAVLLAGATTTAIGIRSSG